MRNRGPICVLLCYVLWGILPIFWKLFAALDAFYVLALRIVWSLPFIAAVLAAGHGFGHVREVWRDRRELVRLALAGLFICINWGGYIWSVNNGHILDASLAYYMSPILSILLGTLVFRERLTKLQWLSVAVAFTGLLIAVLRYRQIPWMALVIGGSFAIYGVIKKGVHRDAAVSTFYETLAAAPFALAYILWMEGQGAGAAGIFHGWQWLLLPASGIVTTVPLLLFARGIRTTPLSLSGILMYVNPTLQMTISVVVYKEAFTATHAILFGFVWSGLVLYLISGALHRRHEKEETSCA